MPAAPHFAAEFAKVQGRLSLSGRPGDHLATSGSTVSGPSHPSPLKANDAPYCAPVSERALTDLEYLELRIDHLKQLIAEQGDDGRANRFCDLADLLTQLGRIEEAGRAMLIAAQRCQENGHAARAGMLARRAFRLDSSHKDVALALWRETTELDDDEFFAPDEPSSPS